MMFTAEDRGRVAAGQITISWRLWKYAHVKAGRIYPTGFGFVEIDDVRAVRVSEVTDDDAREAGFAKASGLVEFARSHTGATVTGDTILYRVEFRYAGERDPRPPRPLLDVETVGKRLQRMDEASARGPWTLDTLRLIEGNPRVVARKLASQLDWEALDFKAHVRRLKALGLTVSYPIGYELSELGLNYLDSCADATWDEEETSGRRAR